MKKSVMSFLVPSFWSKVISERILEPDPKFPITWPSEAPFTDPIWVPQCHRNFKPFAARALLLCALGHWEDLVAE
jgi:hypothetical protein